MALMPPLCMSDLPKEVLYLIAEQTVALCSTDQHLPIFSRPITDQQEAALHTEHQIRVTAQLRCVCRLWRDSINYSVVAALGLCGGDL